MWKETEVLNNASLPFSLSNSKAPVACSHSTGRWQPKCRNDCGKFLYNPPKLSRKWLIYVVKKIAPIT